MPILAMYQDIQWEPIPRPKDNESAGNWYRINYRALIDGKQVSDSRDVVLQNAPDNTTLIQLVTQWINED